MPSLDQITVLTNLELKNADAPTNANHATSNSTFLSGVRAKPTEGIDYYLGTTADQIAAKHISADTPIPSLELGTDLLTVAGQCDNGFNCAYQNCLAWSSPTTPLLPEADPRVVFERLFGDGGTTAERRTELRKNSSILDWVTERIAGLEKQLGQATGTASTATWMPFARWSDESRRPSSRWPDPRFPPSIARHRYRRRGRTTSR